LIAATLADEHPGLDECPHVFFEEERIALGPLDEEPLERLQTSVAPEKGFEEFLCTRRGKRIES
jgi:hypothetical protein